ncbi:MAG: hypothetical protein DRO88_06585 [Promethearchaeia archaeon]|nr:MAG: hypothetical protein DRO88_06585 [Candidatus Lokiarchaeia archaeon]
MPKKSFRISEIYDREWIKLIITPYKLLPEVKRYLGGLNHQEMDSEILQIIEEVIQKSRPQFLLKFFPINVSMESVKVCIEDSDICFKSMDLAKLLSESRECGIVAITLGHEIDRQIALYNKTDLSRGIIFDAAASAYVEAVCDKRQQEVEQKYREKRLGFTFRFAPGYGDLNLSIQPILLNLLNASVKIGISVSKYYTLYPRKSMTGIFGVVLQKNMQNQIDFQQKSGNSSKYQRPKKTDHPKCHSCLNYKHCIYLSEGTYCEYRKRNL